MTKTDNAVFYGIREFFVNIITDNQIGLAVWGWRMTIFDLIKRDIYYLGT